MISVFDEFPYSSVTMEEFGMQFGKIEASSLCCSAEVWGTGVVQRHQRGAREALAWLYDRNEVMSPASHRRLFQFALVAFFHTFIRCPGFAIRPPASKKAFECICRRARPGVRSALVRIDLHSGIGNRPLRQPPINGEPLSPWRRLRLLSSSRYAA